MKTTKLVALLAMVILALGVAGGALGAGSTPSSQQYDSPGTSEPTTVPSEPTTVPTDPTEPKKASETGDPQSVQGSSNGPNPPASTSGTLPFTGQNVGIAVALGGALVLAGLGLRRAGRRSA